MARWDEILTLPVQNPPALEFSAADITWSRVEGWRETMDRLALIPFTRVADFARGESNNKDCPTKFHIEARRRRPPKMPYKPKVDGILEYILYWCSFGPDDHRKGGSIRPSRTYQAKRKSPAGRPNTKRGCVCHFIVKRLIAEPSVALIIYNQDKHIDKNGLPCHGPLDKKAVGTRAMFAPYISDELRLQLTSLLYVGIPVETIMQKHTEMVEKQGGPSSRDDILTHRYVRRLERKIRRSTYDMDSDDDVSVESWVENNQNLVFFYEDFSHSCPFIVGIQSEWQLQQMIRFGNNGILALDSRFGTNKLKYPICSLLIFNSNYKAIPVAWIITPNFASGNVHRWMRSLYDKVHTKDPTWKPGGFIVDDPLVDILTIRDVFQCPVLISLWRIRHVWLKNIMDKCPDIEVCSEIFRGLGTALSNVCRGDADVVMFEEFMEDFVDCSDLLDYFKAVWFPRIGSWVTALKSLPRASVESSVAIEHYHHQVKLRLLNEEDSDVYLRSDWLVDKLGKEVHSYFWLDEYSGKNNFARYWKDEWGSGLTPWQLAQQIPESDVTLETQFAKVVCNQNGKELRIVHNPTSEFALCDCSWSKMGNLCMHVIKAVKVCRERELALPSTSLFDYQRILMSILCSAPHDSILRDHAVALAVSVQSQLDVLCNHENSCIISHENVPMQQQRADTHNSSETTRNYSASEGCDRNLENGSAFIVEKDSFAGDTAVGDLSDMDLQSLETSTSSRGCDEQIVDASGSFRCDKENEPKNLSSAGYMSRSTLLNAMPIAEHICSDSLDDSRDNLAFVVRDVDISINEKIVNIDPESIYLLPSESSALLDNDAEEVCEIHIPEFAENGDETYLLTEPSSFEPMLVEIRETDNCRIDDSTMKRMISMKNHRAAIEEMSIEVNGACHVDLGNSMNIDDHGHIREAFTLNQSFTDDDVGEISISASDECCPNDKQLTGSFILDSMYSGMTFNGQTLTDAGDGPKNMVVVSEGNDTICDNIKSPVEISRANFNQGSDLAMPGQHQILCS